MDRTMIAWGLLGLAFGLFLYWLAEGGYVFTLDRVPIEVKDELFGTTSIEWKEGIRLGLDYAGPAMLLLAAIASVLLYRVRRSQAKV